MSKPKLTKTLEVLCEKGDNFKSTCDVQTKILQINYTGTKSSIKADMCKHRQAKNKNTSIQFALLKCQTVTKNNNSPTTIIYVNYMKNIKFT